MDSLNRWEYYKRLTNNIRRKVDCESHRVCKWRSKVPFMEFSVNKRCVFIRCRDCEYSVTIDTDAENEMFRWFVIPSAWCQEWNFYLNALIKLESQIRTTDLEIKVRGLSEVVYTQLKPDYVARKMEKEPAAED